MLIKYIQRDAGGPNGKHRTPNNKIINMMHHETTGRLHNNNITLYYLTRGSGEAIWIAQGGDVRPQRSSIGPNLGG